MAGAPAATAHSRDGSQALRQRQPRAQQPSDLRHCYMCESRDSGQWYYWPPKGGRNPGQPPHHRVCEACRMSLANAKLVKEQHRVSRCGLEYECPDGACGPHGC